MAKLKGKTGLSTRDKMLKRKQELASRGSKGELQFIKEGTTRLRLKSQGDDRELGLEIVQFYLGGDIGGVISPATFDEPCPLMEKYISLKDSRKESDKNLAAKLVPKRRFIIGGCGYKDEKGKEADPDKIDKAWLVTRSIYQDITDLYLDEDEWGDMTDAEEGYDLKITRSGKGMTDTSYSVTPCSKKPLLKAFSKNPYIDLEAIVRGQIKSYEDIEEILDTFLSSGGGLDEDDDDDTPKKTDTKRKDFDNLKKKKKVKVRDI